MSNKLENRSLKVHLPYLDGWRGIAIICVLLGHFSDFHQLGGIGVSIFFVLSGFLMSRILFVEKIPLRTFYRRRFARIIPAFWLYIVVVFSGVFIFTAKFDLAEFISTAFFFRTYFPVTDIFKSSAPIANIWSLNVEEHCYIFLSLLTLMATRYGEFATRIMLVFNSSMCIGFFILYKYHPPATQSMFTLRTEVAAFPLLLSCTLYLWLRKYPLKVPFAVPFVCFFGAFAIAIFSTSVFLSFVGVSVLLAVSINTLHAAPPWTLWILANPVLRWFGICSYSIYLWQQVFYFFLPNVKTVYGYQLIAVTLVLVVAACSYYFFENPLRKRLAGK